MDFIFQLMNDTKLILEKCIDSKNTTVFTKYKAKNQGKRVYVIGRNIYRLEFE